MIGGGLCGLGGSIQAFLGSFGATVAFLQDEGCARSDGVKMKLMASGGAVHGGGEECMVAFAPGFHPLPLERPLLHPLLWGKTQGRKVHSEKGRTGNVVNQKG